MLKTKQHIHFIGIGGIGMSGLALVLQKQGYHISGCDTVIEQKSITDLQQAGCAIEAHHNGQLCHNSSIDCIVYSTAIGKNNPELVRARNNNITTLHRSELLAWLMNSKKGIAVTGSHGKTTTSSMIADLLLGAQYDPTVLVGGHLTSLNSNAHYGTSEWLVAEADESDRSLLHFLPTFAVLTSIDFDHAETYTDLEDVKNTFKQFLQKISPNGAAIVCIDDANIQTLLPLQAIKTLSYGASKNADFKIVKETNNPTHSIFYIEYQGTTYGPITLNLAGHHNVLNATAAFAIAILVGINPEQAILLLSNFTGVDRRFTFKGLCNGAKIIDDYGHHPVEIKHTLNVARAQTKGKLHVVFQPHRYSRTKHLWQEFLNCFLESSINSLVITDIYPASETPIEGITSQIFVEQLKAVNPPFSVNYIPLDQDFSALSTHVSSILKPDDYLILQGAGKINKLADKLIKK